MGLPTLLLAARLAAAPATESYQSAILIGWDGAQRNHVKELMAKGGLPALAALASSGSIVPIDVLRTTDTKAGWAQILTGCEPETTGVFSNGRFGPIPKGLTVFERVKAAFGPSFVTVAVIGKKEHVDADDESRVRVDSKRFKRMKRNGKVKAAPRIVSGEGGPFLLTPAKPFFNAAPGMDVWENGLRQDDRVGKRAVELLGKYRDKRFFFFVHFAETDHKGHAFGENSPEYEAALKSADTWTGRIVAKLKDLGIDGRTAVYVTADHGFDEGATSHADAPYVFLASNGRRPLFPGSRVDVAPTVLEALGLDPDTLSPPPDGRPLTKPRAAPAW